VDTRGLEFVNFRDRVVLKITGNYNAAYNASLLSQNQRASRVFKEVVMPILQLISKEIPTHVPCDGIGFEISYHVRELTRSYDYEGKEILVVVFDKADAFSFAKSEESTQQEILNRSQIYVNGKEFGLALGGRDPLNIEALERWLSQPPPAPSATVQGADTPQDNRLPGLYQDPPASVHLLKPQAVEGSKQAFPGSDPGPGNRPSGAASASAATPADAEHLQTRYQSQLDALAKEGVAKSHFVDYAPPSFVIFRGRIFLQFTLRSPLHFERGNTSIYRRAAQSFDLFLAPQLKALLEKVPDGAEFDGLDITVLNQLASNPQPSSEAIEFVCPRKPLRQFVEAEITNQELINQSVVLVNGVRIALNLQQVE
jgi:hypothetical protein